MASFRSILVPVIDTPASIDAVNVAADLIRQSRGKLLLLSVIEVERSLPIGADVDEQARHAEHTLRRAMEAAENMNGRVETELLQSRSAGRTIVELAKEKKIEAVLMGIDYKGIVGGFQIGETTLHVLTHAPCQVWVIRDTMEAGG